jgi:hypothetical protein
VKTQQRRGPEDDGRPRDTAFTEKQRPEAKEKPIKRGQIRCTAARAVNHQELLLHQGALRGEGPRASRPEEFRDRD